MSRIHTIAMAFAAVLCAHSACAQAPEDIFKYSGPDRQQKLVEGALKPGSRVLSHSFDIRGTN